jgi:hypothetical protein
MATIDPLNKESIRTVVAPLADRLLAERLVVLRSGASTPLEREVLRQEVYAELAKDFLTATGMTFLEELLVEETADW